MLIIIFTNVIEKLISSMTGAISLSIAVLGVVAIAWYVINAKFKVLSAVLTFLIIAVLSYLAFNPHLIQDIGGKIFYLIYGGIE
jgi:type IV secretory pathway VirB2 component (pilin)